MKELISKILTEKLIKQFIRYTIVGFTVTAIDYGIMILLTEVFDVNYLLSSGISFSIAVVINYFLSVSYVYETNHKRSKVVELVVFIIMSVIGLGLNELIMWIGVEAFSIHYIISKVFATGMVAIYNFITRKLFLEGKLI